MVWVGGFPKRKGLPWRAVHFRGTGAIRGGRWLQKEEGFWVARSSSYGLLLDTADGTVDVDAVVNRWVVRGAVAAIA